MAKKYELVGELGYDKSPLDVIYNAVIDNPADWDILRVLYDGTYNYITELWVKSLNTTNGQPIQFVGTYTRGSSLKVYATETLNTSNTPDTQPGAAPSNYYTANFTKYAQLLRLDTTTVFIDRDFITFTYFLDDSNKYEYKPQTGGFLISSVDKATTFNGGLVFLVSEKQGESYANVLYEGIWQGDSVAGNSDDLACRMNTLYVSGMFPEALGTPVYSYSKVSIHVSLVPLSDDDDLALIGYLPGGIYGTRLNREAYRFFSIDLDGTTYSATTSISCEAINTFLYPIA